jgi:hypothetical protein
MQMICLFVSANEGGYFPAGDLGCRCFPVRMSVGLSEMVWPGCESQVWLVASCHLSGYLLILMIVMVSVGVQMEAVVDPGWITSSWHDGL